MLQNKRMEARDNYIRYGHLVWILQQKKHINGKPDGIQTNSGVHLILAYQCQILSFDKCITVT